MKTSECIDYFGSKAKMARALGIKLPSVYSWRNGSPPGLRQVQIERLTDGKLKADPDCFDVKRAPSSVQA